MKLTFRHWDKPRVVPGHRYRCHPIGVLEVKGVERVRVGDISASDAKLAGFDDVASMLAYMAEAKPLDLETMVYRIALEHAGDGDRIELALEDDLDKDDVKVIREALRKLDDRSEEGPWTHKTLRQILGEPRVAASKLAPKWKLETPVFKARVVRLKKLGLTQSFEVGYEVSPRGRRYLELVGARAR
ncbi:MAG: hypothetical protein U0271_12190 [Polyangiaceae bacterium]